MVKRILLAILGLILVVGVIAGIKVLQIRTMIAAGKRQVPPPAVVTTARVRAEVWQTRLTTVGSLSAVQDVMLSAEIPGKIVKIGFHSGAAVKKGNLLLQLDCATEQARLRAARAAVTLAKIDRDRARELVSSKSTSRARLDTTEAGYQEALAARDEIQALLAKKEIRAPFAGRLGIRRVNLGQVIGSEDPVVRLQVLDPIFADFSLPQQDLALLTAGLPLEVRADAWPKKMWHGTITAISPGVDPKNRQIRVRGTLDNPEKTLHPGMFIRVAVVLPEKNPVLVLPATSILYAPYGDAVFVVEKKKDPHTGKSALFLRKQVVRTGSRRGDFITVTSGLKAGETVVTTGVFKFRNGQRAVVDNRFSPPFKLHPRPADR